MKFKSLYFFLLLTLCGRGMSADFCRYPNTNQLAWDKEFSPAIHRFLGERQENFFYRGPLYGQVLAGLGGPPDEIISVENKLRFASACRAHSCTEKAAVLIACPDKVVAVGILHFDPDTMAATLTVYSPKLNPTIRSAFSVWREKIAQQDDIEIAMEYRQLGPER
nr:hypothetical protein [Massilia sp. PDC64]